MPIHRTPDSMFTAIARFVREHPGAQVLCADDPDQGLIAYMAFVPSGPEQDQEVSEYSSIPFRILGRALRLARARMTLFASSSFRQESARALQEGAAPEDLGYRTVPEDVMERDEFLEHWARPGYRLPVPETVQEETEEAAPNEPPPEPVRVSAWDRLEALDDED